jgi:drug/metabolite transporter (DMT)-like permease
MSPADVARLATLAALWGGSFAFMRVAAPVLGPLWLAESRVTLAFTALLIVALARNDVPSLCERWRDYLVVGVINSACPFALFSFAAQYVTASTAAILNATSPFFSAIVAAVWVGDRLSATKLAGMLLGIGGVGLLVGWHSEPAGGQFLIAVSACLLAALCYAVASVYVKVSMSGTSSFAIALYSQLSAAIALAPALALAPPHGPLTPLVAANVIALALASTALAYLLYFRLIATIGPTRALTVTFLIPLFGVLWGSLFLSEAIGANTLAGGALILLGTWLTLKQPLNKPCAKTLPALSDQTSSAAGPRICSRNSR